MPPDLRLELALKVLPLALLPLSSHTLQIYGKEVSEPNLIVGSLYSVLAIGSIFGLVYIQDLRDADAKPAGASGDPEAGPAGSDRSGPSATEGSAHRGQTDAASDASTTQLHAAHGEARERQTHGGASAKSSGRARGNRLTGRSLFGRMGAAAELWFRRPVVLLLAPIQVAFGVSAALLGYQVTGIMVKQSFGDQAVVVGSLLSALVSLCAAALQPVTRALTPRVGKQPIMMTGLVAFVLLAALVLCLDDTLASPPGLTVLPFYLLQGVGRACYEGTNKALYADVFGAADSPAAFSNMVLANGAASALAYFTFPSLGKAEMAISALACSALAVCSYVAADVILRAPSARGRRA